MKWSFTENSIQGRRRVRNKNKGADKNKRANKLKNAEILSGMVEAINGTIIYAK